MIPKSAEILSSLEKTAYLLYNIADDTPIYEEEQGMNIVVLDGHAVNPGDLSWDWLEEFGTVTVYERTSLTELLPRVRNAHIILTNKTPITRQTLECCPELKLVCVLATGYNVVDCEACRERSIPVCNVPGYSTASVAQFTFALLLELCHQVGHHTAAVHQGRWSSCPDFCFWDTPQMELAGKTMGILGFGQIGRAVGRIAGAMGMKVIACNRSRCPEGEAIGEYVSLDALLSRSDVLSLHCPLTEQTKGILGREALAKMKPGAILLNTARGPLVEEAAVAEALKAGTLRGYGADVACREPINADTPLLAAPNCVLTPHMAWAPTEARQRIIAITTDSIRAFLAGKPIHVVNP